MLSPHSNLDLEIPGKSGSTPKKRVGDFKSALAIFEKLLRADEPRNAVRAKARGLVDGNAPFRKSQLQNAGQLHRTNINFREAESFLSMATGAFYDLFSEAQTYCEVHCEGGDSPEEDADCGGTMTEEFDRLLKKEKCFDFNMQLSQREMVLIGYGPAIWQDEWDWRNTTIEAGDLLIPERTRANLDEWQLAVVRGTYNVAQLHGYIEDESAAKDTGWNVSNARKVIQKAFPQNMKGREDWEYYQSQLRSNDAFFATCVDDIKIAHLYIKEFDGKISHLIFQETDGEDFLFEKVGRFDEWKNIICPFYYDRGDGRHHGVKGMGTKMFSLLEVKNRLKCATVDSAFTETSIMLQGADAASNQEASIVPMGPYSVLKAGMNVIQRTVQTRLEAPMSVDRDLGNVLESNLSQYRRGIEKEGNPRTAEEIRAIVSQAASLGKTQTTRYYEQLDEYFGEMFRRASNPDISEDHPGGKEALAFQKACTKRGVPKGAFKRVRVLANRIAGQGSSSLRQSVMAEIVGVMEMLPEAGRLAVIRDFVASRVGQTKVNQYAPQSQQSKETMDQAAFAQVENGAMKAGVTPVRTGTQNDLIHAQVHMQEAVSTLEKGADPGMTVAFLDIWGPHTGLHLNGLAGSKSRNKEYKELLKQFEEIGKTADQMKKQLQQQQEEQAKAQQEAQMAQQQAQAIGQGTDPETALKTAKAQHDMGLKEAKAQQNLKIKEDKARQDLALRDAQAAAEFAAEPA